MAKSAEKVESADKIDVVEQINSAEQEDFNFDKNVTVKSIANWNTGFARVSTIGDVMIPPNGSIRLTRSEIIAQSQVGNVLFNGIDGLGAHATLFIDDAATRIYLGFESEDGSVKQDVFSDAKVKDAFKLSAKSFEEVCVSTFKTRAEKYALIEAIKRLNLNDYSKIRFVEKYTGYKVEA